ncbi:MAG: M23 family metallopeptidase [Oscillospiraceae bacterium]|jgi:murein DD-endopeptidase MepM/ murein hydrolase activator NlpD|nr:M23 family metallopeptidase [Oscillospiraceae bacterium]
MPYNSSARSVSCAKPKTGSGNAAVRNKAYNAQTCACGYGTPTPSPEPEPTGPTGSTGCTGCTPEAQCQFPKTADGQWDFAAFWAARLAEGWIYPIAQDNDAPFTDPMQQFNADRPDMGACHDGIDLQTQRTAPSTNVNLCSGDSPIYSIADGTVVYSTTGYYEGTGSVIAVYPDSAGNNIVIRYGEIGFCTATFPPFTVLTVPVTKGSVIGYMMNNGYGTHMLHFEAYFGCDSAGNAIVLDSSTPNYAAGPVNGLTQGGNTTYDYVTPTCGKSTFNRRQDLIDPTEVQQLKNNPAWPAS